MGCGLNKLEKHDEKRPGNIYSTLKRPQVETKVDISYEYQFLEFTTSSDAKLPGSAIIRLSSLHDLPVKLQELYQQGFILAAVHPFVQPTNKPEKTLQEQIFRAVLIKKSERSLQKDCASQGNTLEMESCFFSEHLPDKSKMPDLIKKIQDAASRGLKFVGIIPHYVSQMNAKNSSAIKSTSNSFREIKADNNPLSIPEDCASLNHEKVDCANTGKVPAAEEVVVDHHIDPNDYLGGEEEVTEHLSFSSMEENGGQIQETEIFAAFNKPKPLQRSSQYYVVTVPVRMIGNGQSICTLEANWLEYMTDHFRKGSMLVHAIFSLGMINDPFHGITEGLFIFEDLSVDESKSIQGYDAIVVEQWTVLNGAQVQADYIPLLNSLALYGWQLTCVLPTPIVKTNRDGSLATKQIVFLQRPFLPQKTKRKQPKFYWKFSKQDRHSKQAKKHLKTKVRAGEQQQPEEMQESEATANVRNSEANFSTIESDWQFPVISDKQLSGVEDGRTLGHRDMPTYNSDVFPEEWHVSYNVDQETSSCLSQKDRGENWESQMFQEKCIARDHDEICGAEATKTHQMSD